MSVLFPSNRTLVKPFFFATLPVNVAAVLRSALLDVMQKYFKNT
jgi:hypothetical protein